MNQRQVMALLGRYSEAENEFSVPFIPLTTLKSPTSIKTDRIISFLLLHWRGRIAVGTASFTPIADALRYLLQEIRIYGTHAQFGAQTPLRMRAKTQSDLNRIFALAYAPRDKILKGGTAGTFDGTVANFDLDLFWVIPLFLLPMSLQLAPLYSLKGPDWAGNLFVDIDAADGSALGTLGTSTITFTAWGGATGTPTLYVNLVRPLVTVDLMNAISPAICFKSYKTVDSVVQGSSFTLGKITDLNIGKRMAAVISQAGVLQTGVSAGVRSYAALSDGIITRQLVALDGKFLALPSDGLSTQELDSFYGGQLLQVGYNVYSFMRETGNPDTAFAAETLTSARRFELDGDVVAAANQGCEVVQEEILGSPQFLS